MSERELKTLPIIRSNEEIRAAWLRLQAIANDLTVADPLRWQAQDLAQLMNWLFMAQVPEPFDQAYGSQCEFDSLNKNRPVSWMAKYKRERLEKYLAESAVKTQ